MIRENSSLRTGKIIIDVLDKLLDEDIDLNFNYYITSDVFRADDNVMGWRLKVMTDNSSDAYYFCIEENDNGDIVVFHGSSVDNITGMCGEESEFEDFGYDFEEAAGYIYVVMTEVFERNLNLDVVPFNGLPC